MSEQKKDVLGRVVLGCSTVGQCFCTGRCKRTAEEQAAHEAAILRLNESTARMPLGRTTFEPKRRYGPDLTDARARLRAMAGPEAYNEPMTPDDIPAPTASAMDTQVGGDHYKKLKIQPMEYSMANGLDACQHSVVRYVTRFRDKGGIQDLEKAKHCIDMLIEFEGKSK